MIDNGDKCPECGKMAMPKIRPNTHATGRVCQACWYVQDIVNGKPILTNEQNIREWLKREPSKS